VSSIRVGARADTGINEKYGNMNTLPLQITLKINQDDAGQVILLRAAETQEPYSMKISTDGVVYYKKYIVKSLVKSQSAEWFAETITATLYPA